MNREDLKKLSRDELVLKLQRLALTSRMSSKPPSTNREALGLEARAKGHFRAFSEHPDRTVAYRPTTCTNCGQPFAADQAGQVIAEHETLSLPPIWPVVTRHLRLVCACSECG